MATPIQTSFYWGQIISAREAFDAGLLRYFTGKPCKRGHIAERSVSNSRCIVCSLASSNAWKRDNPEKLRAQTKRYYDRTTPEKRRERKRKHWAEHSDQINSARRKKRARVRNIDPEKNRQKCAEWRKRRAEKMAALAGRPRPEECEICGSDAVGVICFDHCHVSQQFRGWLCGRCNRVLGLVKDSPALLEQLRQYLNKHA